MQLIRGNQLQGKQGGFSPLHPIHPGTTSHPKSVPFRSNSFLKGVLCSSQSLCETKLWRPGVSFYRPREVTGKNQSRHQADSSRLGLLPTSQSSVLKVSQAQHKKYTRCHWEMHFPTSPWTEPSVLSEIEHFFSPQ